MNNPPELYFPRICETLDNLMSKYGGYYRYTNMDSWAIMCALPKGSQGLMLSLLEQRSRRITSTRSLFVLSNDELHGYTRRQNYARDKKVLLDAGLIFEERYGNNRYIMISVWVFPYVTRKAWDLIVVPESMHGKPRHLKRYGLYVYKP